MSDTTAEALGGREHVEQMYERIGDGGQIVIHSPADSKEMVARLFYQAKIFSGADPFLIDSEAIENAITKAHSVDSPSFRSTDLDGDGEFDIGSYRYLPEYFEAEQLHFPGSVEQVRDFITGHELGHKSHAGGQSPWEIWQSETNADQDAFRAMGESATLEFQRGILATRAGDTLTNILYGELLFNRNSRDFGEEEYVRNEAYKHATVLGTFLPGEIPYAITEEGMNASLSDFTAKIVTRMNDNYVAQNPNFEIDTAAFSSHTFDINKSAESLNSFLGEQSPETAAMYNQFQQNIDDLQGQLESLETLRLFSNGSEIFANYKDMKENEIYSEMRTEYQQAMAYMQETNPEMFQDYIRANHPDVIVRQTEFRGTDFDSNVSRTRMAEIVLQLRDEGAFDNDPMQKRLADYIEIDMEIRPHRYAEPGNNTPQPEQTPEEPSLSNIATMRVPS